MLAECFASRMFEGTKLALHGLTVLYLMGGFLDHKNKNYSLFDYPCSLRSKRFRGVGEQRKTKERDFQCFACGRME